MTHPLKQYLVPVTLEHFDSKFNSNIEVISFIGQVHLNMGGLTQSGDIIRRIWSKAVKTLTPSQFKPKNILLLGVGGGSAAGFLHRRWPEAQIVGVEIDPEVIRIANQYFAADQIPNFSIINDDGISFANRLDSKYDLIMVDCYQGDQIPKALEDIKLLKHLKSYSQYLLLNRLFWDDYQTYTLKFISSLEPHFSVKTCRTPSNLVLSLSDL